MKRIEWPRSYADIVEPKIAQLEALVRVNALSLLRGVWTITCDKCHQNFEITLTAEGIGNLLSLKYMDIECQNPNCERIEEDYPDINEAG